MRVSSKGRYAVVALVDVAENSTVKPVALADVAARQRISLSYLEQLFALLRRAGLVQASRGPGGGYRLQRGAGEISVAEVFRAVEEPGTAAGDGSGRDWSRGPAAGLWGALDEHVEHFLDRATLANLVGEAGRDRVVDVRDGVAGAACQ
jgi:Rrf2 family transcriptional regulator, iron-sulfur cluster assembly transcription factor